MSGGRQAELEAMRWEALAPECRAAMRRSAEAVAAWERDHPSDVGAALAWIDELRAVFGDPPVDRTPWRGDDFRL